MKKICNVLWRCNISWKVTLSKVQLMLKINAILLSKNNCDLSQWCDYCQKRSTTYFTGVMFCWKKVVTGLYGALLRSVSFSEKHFCYLQNLCNSLRVGRLPKNFTELCRGCDVCRKKLWRLSRVWRLSKRCDVCRGVTIVTFVVITMLVHHYVASSVCLFISM